MISCSAKKASTHQPKEQGGGPMVAPAPAFCRWRVAEGWWIAIRSAIQISRFQIQNSFWTSFPQSIVMETACRIDIGHPAFSFRILMNS
jgi:hypothetical protein